MDAVLKAVKDKTVKAIDALPKDADEVDAALRSFTAALEHAATDDTTNGTNLTNATTPKVAEKSAHDSEHKAATKAKGPPGLNERVAGSLRLGNATDATKCVAVCGQKRPTTTGVSRIAAARHPTVRCAVHMRGGCAQLRGAGDPGGEEG